MTAKAKRRYSASLGSEESALSCGPATPPSGPRAAPLSENTASLRGEATYPRSILAGSSPRKRRRPSPSSAKDRSNVPLTPTISWDAGGELFPPGDPGFDTFRDLFGMAVAPPNSGVSPHSVDHTLVFSRPGAPEPGSDAPVVMPKVNLERSAPIWRRSATTPETPASGCSSGAAPPTDESSDGSKHRRDTYYLGETEEGLLVLQCQEIIIGSWVRVHPGKISEPFSDLTAYFCLARSEIVYYLVPGLGPRAFRIRVPLEELSGMHWVVDPKLDLARIGIKLKGDLDSGSKRIFETRDVSKAGARWREVPDFTQGRQGYSPTQSIFIGNAVAAAESFFGLAEKSTILLRAMGWMKSKKRLPTKTALAKVSEHRKRLRIEHSKLTRQANHTLASAVLALPQQPPQIRGGGIQGISPAALANPANGLQEAITGDPQDSLLASDIDWIRPASVLDPSGGGHNAQLVAMSGWQMLQTLPGPLEDAEDAVRMDAGPLASVVRPASNILDVGGAHEWQWPFWSA